MASAGVSGLSAAGITSGLATAGAVIGGGMIAGIAVLAVPVVAAGGAGAAGAHALKKWDEKKRLKAKKEQLCTEISELINEITQSNISDYDSLSRLLVLGVVLTNHYQNLKKDLAQG